MNLTKARARALNFVQHVNENYETLEERVQTLGGVVLLAQTMDDKELAYFNKHTVDVDVIHLHMEHLRSQIEAQSE